MRAEQSNYGAHKRQSEQNDNRKVVKGLDQADTNYAHQDETNSLRLSYVRMHGVDESEVNGSEHDEHEHASQTDDKSYEKNKFKVESLI